MIFVSDMGDSLSRAVSFEFLKHEVIDVALTPSGSKHVWQWLTKRPARMAEFSQWLGSDGIEWPSNVWAGTSVTDRATRSRVTNLLRVGGIHTTRFLSVEPQTEDLDLAAWLPRLDWVIQGGESGRDPRAFDLDWARRLRAECIEARVAYFLKQVGARVLDRGRKVKLRDTHGGDWSEWPEDLRARQMPRITATDRDPCSSPGSG
jgi:protein gp37